MDLWHLRKINKRKIILFHLTYSSSGSQEARVSPGSSGRDPTGDRTPFYCRATHTWSDWDSVDTAIHLTRTSLGGGRKLKSTKPTQTWWERANSAQNCGLIRKLIFFPIDIIMLMTMNVTTLSLMMVTIMMLKKTSLNKNLFEDLLQFFTPDLPHPPSDSRVHKTAWAFCSGSLSGEKTSYLCIFTCSSTRVLVHAGEQKRVSLHSLLSQHPSEWVKAFALGLWF